MFPLSTNQKSLPLVLWLTHLNFNFSHWSTPKRKHPAPCGRTSCFNSHWLIKNGFSFDLDQSKSNQNQRSQENHRQTSPYLASRPSRLKRAQQRRVAAWSANCLQMQRRQFASWPRRTTTARFNGWVNTQCKIPVTQWVTTFPLVITVRAVWLTAWKLHQSADTILDKMCNKLTKGDDCTDQACSRPVCTSRSDQSCAQNKTSMTHTWCRHCFSPWLIPKWQSWSEWTTLDE